MAELLKSTFKCALQVGKVLRMTKVYQAPDNTDERLAAVELQVWSCACAPGEAHGILCFYARNTPATSSGPSSTQMACMAGSMACIRDALAKPALAPDVHWRVLRASANFAVLALCHSNTVPL